MSTLRRSTAALLAWLVFAPALVQADGAQAKPRAVDLAVYGRLLQRRFDYEDDLYDVLRSYRLRAGGGLALAGSWFPGAHFTDGPGAHLGVGLRFERTFGLESHRSDGTAFPTELRELVIDARGRLPVGEHVVGASVGGGLHAFDIRIAGPAIPGVLNLPDIPSVEYRFLRFAVDARLALPWRLAVVVEAGFRKVLDPGGIAADVWFPRATANGVDFALFVSRSITCPRARHALDVRAGLDLRRYFLDMRARPGDGFVAGGALDRYLGLALGVGYRF